MALSNSNSYIASVLNASTDALNNLYIVTFRGDNLDDVATPLQLRCDSFTPITVSQAVYTVRYLNNFVDRGVARMPMTRSFTLSLRVDSQYEILKAILDQQGVNFNPSKSFTATAIDTLKENNQLFDVTVEVVDEGITTEVISTSAIFKFYDCWVSSVQLGGYSYDNSAPQTATVTINFLRMEDLQSGITGETDSPNVTVGQ